MHMRKLFIIGNGFDLAHGLATSYENFRNYLCDTYIVACEEEYSVPIVPSVSMGPHGEDICNMEDVVKFLVYLISSAESDVDKWCDLERSLGLLDYDEFFDMLTVELDKDGDIDNWKRSCNNEALAFNIFTVVSKIRELFEEWVVDIDIKSVQKKMRFYDLIQGEDIFLSFNYTETLEDVYGIDGSRVCHIHGERKENILFGHGNMKNYTEEYMRANIGSENALSELDDFLKKDTKQALREHGYFFKGIDNSVKEVYSMGFSFAEVDLIYIKEICRKLPADAVWYLNDFEPADIPTFQRKIMDCGFKGAFATFSV